MAQLHKKRWLHSFQQQHKPQEEQETKVRSDRGVDCCALTATRAAA
jgi:hypothetical protein